MSITVKQSPADFSSANHELWHVVESTNKATTGFKYVFDIYKGADLLTRVKNTPQGTGQYGVLDVHNIVRSEMDISLQSFNPFDFSDSFEGGADVFFLDYDVRYGEVSGGVLSTNIASGTYKAYNNYLRKPYEVSTALTSGTYKLSNRPQTSKIYDGQPLVLSVRTNNGVNYDRQKYKNGSPVSGGGFTGNLKSVTFGMGDSDSYDEFRFVNSDTSANLFTMYFELACSKYQPYTLVFLNAFGAWDSFTFIHGRLTNDNEKKKFEKYKWELNGFTMQEKSGSVYNEGLKTYTNTISPKMKLTSDILNTDEYTWLAELVNSPCVYIYLEDEFHPVQINTSNYEFKNSLQNKTETLEVEIEFIKNNTQYR